MSRRLTAEIAVRGQLKAMSPVAVGGTDTIVGLDLTLMTDGQGRYVIPGTTLAGVLRDRAQQALGDQNATVAAMFGGADDHNGAALLTVFDAPCTAEVVPEVRDHVRIDRNSGAAAKGGKYDRQVLPSGTKFEFEMVLAVLLDPAKPQLPSDLKSLLGMLIGDLVGGRIRLGASTTSGLGRVEFQQETVVETDLSSRDGMLSALFEVSLEGEVGQESKPDWLPQADETKGASLHRLSLEWETLTPVLVHGPDVAPAISHLPLMTRIDAQHQSPDEGAGELLAPVLPGSSIKGVLRSRAERIMSTVLGCEAAPTAPEAAYLPVYWLFGAGRQDEPVAGKLLGRGALSFEDCVARAPHIAAEVWADVVRLPTRDGQAHDPSWDYLKGTALKDWHVVTHVAIDRWTGGAADGLLFADLEPRGVDWPKMTISFRGGLPTAETEPHILAGWALLALVLGEFAQGTLGFGHGTTRGLGQARLTGASWGAKELNLDAPDANWPTRFLDSLQVGLAQEATQAWAKWVKGPSSAEKVGQEESR